MTKELPENWTKLPLSDLLASLESGARPRGGVRGITEGIPSIGGEHLSSNGQFDFSSIKFVPKKFAAGMKKGRIQTNDVLIVKDGATTGKVSFVTESFPYKEAYVNEHVFVCRPSGKVIPKFLFYFLYSQEGQRRILENFKGSAQGGINQSFAPNTEVPIAPPDEQKLIVAKLERILTKLYQAKERLETIPRILKRFRQSVLDAACSGRLTANWRIKNKADEWANGILADMIEGTPKNGYSAKPVNYVTKYKVLTLTATTSGRFIPDHFKYFDEPIPTESPFWLMPGDILVQRGNTIEYVGVSAIYEGTAKEFIYPDLMMKLRPNSRVITKFLYFILSWERTRNYLRENATGTAGNMPKINQATLMSAPINLPSLPEQEEIVKRVDGFFKSADLIEMRYLKAKNQVDKLSQSVLAKAFRGELVAKHSNATVEVKALQPTKPSLKTETLTDQSLDVVYFRSIVPRREERYVNCVPSLDLEIAAGAFGEDQRPNFNDWVEINTSRPLKKGMFVAKVVGRSMEPLIPDGAHCLFQFKAPQLRNDMIAVFQLHDSEDPESGGHYTVKRLRAYRQNTDEGIVRKAKLIPENPAFQPITVDEDNVKFIAEFLEVLQPLGK